MIIMMIVVMVIMVMMVVIMVMMMMMMMLRRSIKKSKCQTEIISAGDYLGYLYWRKVHLTRIGWIERRVADFALPARCE